MKVYEILPGKLYQRGDLVNLSLEDKIAGLQEYGIDVVVNVYKHDDHEIRKYLYDYIFHPMVDGKNWDPVGIMEIVDYVVDLILDGHVVLVHCHAGRNRSGFVSALIVRKLRGISGKRALAYVRKKRPRAIATESFETFLEALS